MPFQDVGAGEEQAEHGDGRVSGQDRTGAPHDQELGDKAVQSGQTQRGHAGEDQDAAVDRHEREQAAELFQVAGMRPLVDHADQEEHARRR